MVFWVTSYREVCMVRLTIPVPVLGVVPVRVVVRELVQVVGTDAVVNSRIEYRKLKWPSVTETLY